MAAQTWTGLSQQGATIAISNWNQELLLPRAIDSAMQAVARLREDGLPGEVLVIDEGSRDGSPMLLRQLEVLYFRENLRVLSLADTGSTAAGRNLALANARYRYVVFVDADKELLPENLPSFVRALRETEAAVVYGNLLVRAPASRCALNLISNESVQQKLFQSNYIDGLALVDRCQLLDVGGFESSYRAQEDHELWLHLAANGRKIVFVPLVFGYSYALPSSTAEQGETEAESQARNQRIFNRLQARAHQPLNANQLRFHPALGYF